MTLTNIDTAMSAYRESTRDARFVPVERISPIRRADRGPAVPTPLARLAARLRSARRLPTVAIR